MTFRKLVTAIAIVLSVVYIGWWIWLALYVSPENDIRNWYSLTYGIVAGFGGVIGLIISHKWGGFKSYVGKSLIFFSFGLLCQFLGQNTYSIQYLIDHIENSYPSYGEIFFFISMPSYILGVWYIAKASGSQVSLNQMRNKLGSIILPVLMMVISYYLFVRGNLLEDQSFVVNALTFSYPLGQAIFVSFAIVAYYLAGKVLGGIMKSRVALLLFSLVFQYFADTVFLFKTIQGDFYHADYSEFLFAVSYVIMTFAFISFLSVFEQLKANNQIQ